MKSSSRTLHPPDRTAKRGAKTADFPAPDGSNRAYGDPAHAGSSIGACLAAVLLSVAPLSRVSIARAAAPPPARLATPPSVGRYLRHFEAAYRDVRTLRANFTQTYSAWGRARVESGTVWLERGNRMRWEYHQPQQKLFISNGKELLLYVPAEKQLTRSALKQSDDLRVPIGLLLARMSWQKAFSHVEFADQALDARRGDRVLCAYPKSRFAGDYRDVLVELTPALDVRRLVVDYPDNTIMQFEFTEIRKNTDVSPDLFEFSPPRGTEIIQQ